MLPALSTWMMSSSSRRMHEHQDVEFFAHPRPLQWGSRSQHIISAFPWGSSSFRLCDDRRRLALPGQGSE